jgi:hypothetical protein
VEGSGGGASRGTAGAASSTLVTGVEARGRPFDEGEMKGRGHRFDSTPTGCEWVTDGSMRSSGKPAGRMAVAQAGGGRRPRDGPNGPEWATLAGLRWAGVGISKENRDGLPWPLGRIDGLNRRAYRKCF